VLYRELPKTPVVFHLEFIKTFAERIYNYNSPLLLCSNRSCSAQVNNPASPSTVKGVPTRGPTWLGHRGGSYPTWNFFAFLDLSAVNGLPDVGESSRQGAPVTGAGNGESGVFVS
jgi:hypothetical protein